MKPNRRFVFLTAVVAVSLIAWPAYAQGPLTPPGAPGTTMKSLDQIEARTPVDATHTPGISTAQFNITQPGSYYLTGNISVVGNKHGINIQTNDVTLDLNGFEMIGVSNFFDGIVMDLGVQNTVIRNGTLRNWTIGLVNVSGYAELDHLRVYGCQGQGFFLGDHSAVRNCAAVSNGGVGVQIGNGCVVVDCLVCSNATYGIFGGIDTTVRNCTVAGNGSAGIKISNACIIVDCLVCSNLNFAGITGGSDCVVSGCQASGNAGDGIFLADNSNVSKCTANYSAFGNGFFLGNSSRIHECIANTNYSDGIGVGSGSTVTGCIANGNGAPFFANGISIADDSVAVDNHASGNTADGIETFGGGCQIEHNQTTGNADNGINAFPNGGAPNVVVRNTSTGNGSANYSPASGATFGPIQTPATATSPSANF